LGLADGIGEEIRVTSLNLAARILTAALTIT
jgi:hypothetical protein